MTIGNWRQVFLDVITVVTIGAVALSSQGQCGSPRTCAGLIRRIQGAMAESPEIGAPLAAEAYEMLFSGMSADNLQEIASSAPTGVALQAMWQLRGHASRRQFAPDNAMNPVRYLTKESRLRVPEAWAASLDVSFHSGDQIELNRVLGYYYQRSEAPVAPAPKRLRDLGVEFVLKSPAPRHGTTVGFSVDEGVRVSMSGNSLRITQGSNSVSCDGRILPVRDNLRGSSCHCTVIVGPRLSFVTFSDDDAEHYPLYCIDTHTGDVRWRAQVWGIYPTGIPYSPSGPSTRHDVHISADKNFIAVFGSALQQYVDVFKTESGEVAARFSTNLWVSPGKLMLGREAGRKLQREGKGDSHEWGRKGAQKGTFYPTFRTSHFHFPRIVCQVQLSGHSRWRGGLGA